MRIACNFRAVIEDTQKEFGFWIACERRCTAASSERSIFPSMLLLVA
jgi:hypothetical protein